MTKSFVIVNENFREPEATPAMALLL